MSSSSDESVPPRTLDERIREATDLKAQGNARLKDSVDEAHGLYKKALKELDTTTNDAVETLKNSIRMNLSLTSLKLALYTDAIKFATEVLQKNPDNAKCLFRRGQAYLERGDLDEAKADLMSAGRLEPNNAAIRQALAKTRRSILAHKESTREMSANIFRKGQSLYGDMEEAMRRREEENRIKEEKERKEWETEKELGETDADFDEWKRQKAPPTPATPATPSSPPKSPARPKPQLVKSDSEEYDEEEKKIIAETKAKGYCYFRREQLTQAELELKQLKPEPVAPSPASSATQPSSSAQSHWNVAGTTWEEKDVSDDSKAALISTLSSVELEEGDHKLTVTEVHDVRGEASLAVVRGSVRFIYDYDELKLKWKVTKAGEQVLDGSMVIHDLSSCRTSDDTPSLLHCMRIARMKHRILEDTDPCRALLSSLPSQLSSAITTFESLFV